MSSGFAATDYRRHPAAAATLALVGLAAGFVAGAIAHRSHGAFASSAPFISWFGRVWLNALVMTALPLVISLLVVAVLGVRHAGPAGRLGGTTMLVIASFLITTGIAAIAAGSGVVRWFPASPQARAAMQASLPPARQAAAPSGSLSDWVTNLVPGNIFHSLASGDVLPVIIAALLFAVAARGIAEERRALLLRLAEAISDMCLALARILMRVLPLAVFSMAFAAAAQAGATIAGGMAYFVVVLCVLLVAATVLLYPLTALLGRIAPRRFGVGVWPCQVVAFTTRSSLASLPSLLDRGESRIGLPTPVAKFVLPLAVAIFKLDPAISTPMKLILLGHLYGVPVGVGLKLVFVLIAAVVSFGTPGIPNGETVATLPLYLAAGLPLQAVVLFYAVDAIPDFFKTILNVTADMSLATIVARFTGNRLAPTAGESGPAVRAGEAMA